jgi:TATA-binding protein-associated factor Taf7
MLSLPLLQRVHYKPDESESEEASASDKEDEREEKEQKEEEEEEEEEEEGEEEEEEKEEGRRRRNWVGSGEVVSQVMGEGEVTMCQCLAKVDSAFVS